MIRWLAFKVRHRCRQSGQSLVLMALMMPVLLGFAGLSLDYGRLAVERRKLQNVADAAALAGIQDFLPGATSSQYQSDALNHLRSNGYSGSGNDSPYTISTSGSPSNTLTVTANRTVPLNFMLLLGVRTKVVSGTATATVSYLQTCNTSQANTACFPFVAWWQRYTNGQCVNNKVGDIIIFHDNGYVNNDGPGNCGWGGNSNNEDGYVRPN